ncbi:MAG: MBL fold metallo-hydrolase [Deltaproteobacteria bacterium]|nr:MBL fold metallo-hydrolase [Deltaproteobacteria bacterium]
MQYFRGVLCVCVALIMSIAGMCACDNANVTRDSAAPGAAGDARAIGMRQADGVWWFTRPDGERFVSLGINHIEPVFIGAPSNRSIFMKKYGKDLLNWAKRPNLQGRAVRRWMEESVRQIEGWGFNSLGWHNPIPQSRLPYVSLCRVADIDGWNVLASHYPDPFDDATRLHVESKVAEWAAKNARDSLILGVSFNDMPIWRTTPGERHPWLAAIMGLRADAPGKAKWIAHLRTRYPSAREAGAVLGVEAASWDALASRTDWPVPTNEPKVAGDEAAFLAEIAEAWYGLLAATVRRTDPNHLILGDKLEGERDLPTWLDPILARHVDVIYIQWYGDAEHQIPRLDALHRATGKPILLGDSTFSFPTETMPNPKGVHVASREAVGEAYRDYLQAVMARPYIVGWHHCGYIDSAPDMRGYNALFARQPGFLRSDGTPWDEVLANVVPANRAAHGRHAAASPAPTNGTASITAPSPLPETVSASPTPPTSAVSVCTSEAFNDRAILTRMADNVFVLRANQHASSAPFKSISWVTTPEGAVVIDTGMPGFAKIARKAIRKISGVPVHSIIYTHHHGTNVAGTRELMDDGTKVIAHRDLVEAFRSGKELSKYHARINSIQFDFNTNPMAESIAEQVEPVYPDFTYDDHYEFTLGGVEFQLFHVVGEAEDYTITYLPSRGIVWTGDMVGFGAPMVASPMKPVRSEVAWKRGLERIASYRPRMLVSSVGPPVCDPGNVSAMIDGRIAYLEFLHEAVIAELNKGSTEEEAVRNIHLTGALADSIFAQDMYGSLEFNVRGIFQRYSGWFDQNGSHLKPAPSVERAANFVADMGGPERVYRKATELRAARNHRLALEYLDLLIASNPADARARTQKGEVLIEMSERYPHPMTGAMLRRLGKMEQDKAKSTP